MLTFSDYKFKLVSINDIKREKTFRKRRYPDAIYYGLTNEGKAREGKGIMIYNNQRMYEGDWSGDVRNGYG